MAEIFATFGIDWRLLLINTVNFGVVLFVLWYFLYAPVMKILEERRQKMAKGVEDAQKAEAELGAIKGSRAEMLAKAGKEADSVVSEARSAGATKQKELILQAEAAAARTIEEAKAEAEDLKNKAVQESKQEVAKLIVLGMEKALSVQGGSASGRKQS